MSDLVKSDGWWLKSSSDGCLYWLFSVMMSHAAALYVTTAITLLAPISSMTIINNCALYSPVRHFSGKQAQELK